MTYIRSKMEPHPDAGASTLVGAASATRREIVAEHRQIRDLVSRLETTGELEALLPRLAELRGLLVSHFAREEAPGGLHQVVDGSAPRLAGAVQVLCHEHRELLARVDDLAERARACLDGPVAEVRGAVADLCRGLHAHEAAETELLAGALYEDVGGGD